jgi:NRPS condensation-like uncharacterized protein
METTVTLCSPAIALRSVATKSEGWDTEEEKIHGFIVEDFDSIKKAPTISTSYQRNREGRRLWYSFFHLHDQARMREVDEYRLSQQITMTPLPNCAVFSEAHCLLCV